MQDQEVIEAPAKIAPGSARRTLKLLASYLSGRKALVVGLGFAILTSNGLRLVNPLILRSFIDAIAGGATGSQLYRHAGLFIALALAVQALAVVAAWLGQDLGWKATNDLRLDVMRSCMAMDLDYHKEHLPGELIERVDGDAKTLMSFFSDFAIRLVGSVALMAGVLVTLFIEDARVGVAMGAFAAVAAFFLFKVALLAVPVWMVNRAKAAEFYGFVGERLAAREDLKSLGAAPYASSRLRALLGDWYPLRLKANLLGYSMWTSSELAAGLGTVLSLGLGAALWRAGTISLGTVYLIYSYAELIRQPLDQLREQLEDLQKALAGTSRTMEMLNQRPGMSYGQADLPAGALGLSFHDLSFGYEAGKRILENFNLDLEPGTSLGVLGRTGCGKTTLGRLALRLYDRDAGLVELAGRPIDEYSVEALRRGLAVVTQDVELFSATLRDNARLWDPSIGDEAILTAFDELGLGEWLAGFPLGLDQRLGAGGVGLSAGQAQLLAMVRVFLRNPGLIILDEASSRLDPATEALIDGAVAKLLKGRTAMIIAHRLSTLDRVDRVLVMEDGKAVEYGDRARLAADPESRFSGFLRAGRSGKDEERLAASEGGLV
ncbi:MAG: hypothetical protein A2Y38_24735 [Spirochaetes bacterium GWB1_59_5]|nr:MAG: hypothetical protein A2Y38_24735 [Spirochaetes bacterium GWB1_59_5]